MQARGEAVVSLIVRLRKEVEGIVAALAEDADEVAKARTLGWPPVSPALSSITAGPFAMMTISCVGSASLPLARASLRSTQPRPRPLSCPSCSRPSVPRPQPTSAQSWSDERACTRGTAMRPVPSARKRSACASRESGPVAPAWLLPSRPWLGARPRHGSGQYQRSLAPSRRKVASPPSRRSSRTARSRRASRTGHVSLRSDQCRPGAALRAWPKDRRAGIRTPRARRALWSCRVAAARVLLLGPPRACGGARISQTRVAWEAWR
jgi:hypothetical protein